MNDKNSKGEAIGSESAKYSAPPSSIDNSPNTSRSFANKAMDQDDRSKSTLQTSHRTPEMLKGRGSNPQMKAERDEVDSIGYQPSASEDDDVRQSDSQSSSRRQSRLGKMTPPLGSNESNVSSPSSAHPAIASSSHANPSFTSAMSNANQQGTNAIQNKHRNLRALQSALSPTGSLSGASGSIPALSSHSHSGGEASASSSRSHLPLQSKTSLYRRQASAASSVSNEPMDDIISPGHFTGRGSESLSRAKSVSSVSSVNSTSSMEAVPFRAAPLGNVRVGFGGLARAGAARANMANSSASNRGNHSNMPNTAPPALKANTDVSHHRSAYNDLAESSTDQDVGKSGRAPVISAANEAGANSPISPTKQRYLPKGPSDEWQYRNAPGMGGGRGSRPLPHTISAGSRPAQPRKGIPSAFAGLLANDDVESDESSLHQVQRPKPSIRTKLAKRAGKLGLKPLTSVQTLSTRSSSPPPAIMLDQGTSLTRKDAQSSAIISTPMIIAPPAPSTPTSHSSAELASRSAKSYFSSMGNPSGGISNMIGSVGSVGTMSFLESDMSRATSSITNAPLVVPKHPPGPPGSGPPPSPGLVGSAANYVMPFAQIPSHVSPKEEQPVTGVVPATDQVEQMREAGLSTPDSARPKLSRPGSVSSGISGVLGGILGTSNIGGGNSNRSSYGPHANIGPPRSSSTSPSPIMLTPAQKIQMDARAGLAVVPSEPSGASPGPDGDQDVLSDLSIATIGRRPMSNSISTQTTAKPKESFTVAQNPSPLSGASVPFGGSKESSSPRLTNRRPNLLRALTGESIGRRSLGSIKNDDSRFVENQNRSGHSSPRSPSSGSDKYVLSIEKSPSSLRLEIPSNPILEEGKTDFQPSRPSLAIKTPKHDSQTSSTAALVSSHTNEATNGDRLKRESGALKVDDYHAASINSETRPSDLPSIAISTTSTIAASVDAKSSQNLAQPRSGESIMTPSQLDSSPQTPIASKVPNITNASRIARTREDFYFGDLIGEGSYSTVMEAWDLLPLREKGINTPKQDSGDSNNALAAIAGKTSKKKRGKVNLDGAKVYAIKILDKVHILKEKKQKYVSVEKEALSLLTRHPGVITLFWTFQDRDSLYFVLEMAPNGELLNWIKKLGSFNEHCAKYYTAQLLDTIQGIHKAGVLHRDVKPENVLLDSDMRVSLADFGSAKIIGKAGGGAGEQEPQAKFKQRSSSFVGTAEYVSPELLTDKQVSEASDYWAIGCILFQMLCGRPPFKGASEYQTFQKIMRGTFDFQPGFSEVAIDLISKLLKLNPDDRPSADEIRAHAFFEGIDWKTIWTIDAPKLEAGLYKRLPVAPPSNPESVEGDASLNGSLDSQDDGIATASEVEEDGSRSEHDSLQSGEVQNTQTNERDVTGDNDADDDDSSLSDSPIQSQQNQVFRKRGFSAGASAAERMLAQVSNTTRRGSNLINKVTAGLTSFDRNDSSSTPSKGQQRSSIIGSVRPALSSRSSSQMSNRDQDNNNAIWNQQAADAVRFNASLATSWAALLLPNESLLYACPIVHKTSGPILRSTNKKRQLLLTDFPRLLCVKETNDQLKVKSEVILGIPLSVTSSKGKGNIDHQSYGSGRPHHNRLNSTGSMHSMGGNNNASIVARRADSPSLDPKRDRVSAVRSSQMRRQSSAGPLLPSSPTSSTGASSALRHSTSASMARDNSTGGSSNHLFNSAMAHSSPLTPTQSRSSQVNFGSGPIDEKHITPSLSLADVSQASPNMMTSIEAKSIRSFIVHTPARSYLYEDPSGDASHWIKSITLATKRQTNIFNPTTDSSNHAVPLTSHYTMPA